MLFYIMWNPHLVSSGNNDLNFCLLGNFSALPYSLFFLMITGSRIILISSHSISMVENTELLRKISAVICHSLPAVTIIHVCVCVCVCMCVLCNTYNTNYIIIIYYYMMLGKIEGRRRSR